MRFAQELKEDVFAPRDFIARDLLALEQEEFSRAFSKSPMKRAKLPGLKRNAAAALGDP